MGPISARLIHLVARFYLRQRRAWSEGMGLRVEGFCVVDGGQELKRLAGEPLCSRH